MADTVIELQRGLEFYYESQREFERRELPIDKQVAFGFEAGYQAGRAESLADEALKLIRNPHITGNFVPNGQMREWA